LQPPGRQDLVGGRAGQAAILERAALHALVGRDRQEVAARAAVAIVEQPRRRHPIAEAHRQPARDRAVGDERREPCVAGAIEVARAIRTDVRQERDVAAAAGGELGQPLR